MTLKDLSVQELQNLASLDNTIDFENKLEEITGFKVGDLLCLHWGLVCQKLIEGSKSITMRRYFFPSFDSVIKFANIIGSNEIKTIETRHMFIKNSRVSDIKSWENDVTFLW